MHGDDYLATIGVAPFLVTSLSAYLPKAVPAQHPNDIFGTANRNALARLSATSSTFAPAGNVTVQAQTKGLALLWRFAQPPLRYRRPKRILAIRERTPPSVWFGDRVQLPAEVSWQKRITPRVVAGKPQMSDEPFALIRG